MKYGISSLSIIPVRQSPGDRYEQVSQLLFGEHFSVLEKTEKWIFIEIAHDTYRGWIDSKQFTPITEEDFYLLESAEPYLTNTLLSTLHLFAEQRLNDSAIQEQNSGLTLVAGSILPFYTPGSCRLGNVGYQVSATPVQATGKQEELLLFFSRLYMNSPYQWGGRSPFGIDCSGLTQLYGRFLGLKLPRDASEQALEGSLVDTVENTRNGDLAFFENQQGRIVHVGLVYGCNKILHASGQVRLDSLHATGIFDEERRLYTHKLCSIRRLSV